MRGDNVTPPAQYLPMIDGFLIMGGAPGGHLDEQCAMAGLDAVREQLK
ncbi:hypothetical protein [Metapseudomonas resinovorans]|uniref:Uncharacterized protein n=1 Tax=Metapseudomonas resinovorans NBRC 106553 TaxID=1245471 RepID=S6BD84_METRE|nr:hypothetical protein [Pseudomonas resinovorans]BAN46979.1 hypothetical protein PCA10_12470 [Pseudomonas resinovorans NBRC 106553]